MREAGKRELSRALAGTGTVIALVTACMCCRPSLARRKGCNGYGHSLGYGDAHADAGGLDLSPARSTLRNGGARHVWHCACPCTRQLLHHKVSVGARVRRSAHPPWLSRLVPTAGCQVLGPTGQMPFRPGRSVPPRPDVWLCSKAVAAFAQSALRRGRSHCPRSGTCKLRPNSGD